MKTSPKAKRSYSVIENERFGLVFAKPGSIISGTGQKESDQEKGDDKRGEGGGGIEIRKEGWGAG